MPAATPESPPLLPSGLHVRTMKELRAMCVGDFRTSATREKLMSGLERVVEELRAIGVPGQLWIDGSFVTRKVDPNDVDFVLSVDYLWYCDATKEQRAAVDLVAEGLKRPPYYCDSYIFPQWPVGHPLYWYGENQRNYWMLQWGFSREGDPKGIMVVELSP